MRKLHVVLALGLSIGLIGQSFATCQKDYVEAMAKPILPKNVQIDANAVTILGYGVGALAFGTTGGIVGAVAMPIGLILGLWGAKEIRNNPLHEIERLLNQSDYVITQNTPAARTDFEKEVAVDGKTAKERRQQKKQNRSIRRHNREVNKFNKQLAKELVKSRKSFEEFYAKIEATATGISQEDFAKAVNDSNNANEMCNGKIGTFEGPAIEYQRQIAVDGQTKKERKQQERFNKKVRRHNNKMAKLESKNRLAKKSEIIHYFSKAL